jgi:hypothetical protein
VLGDARRRITLHAWPDASRRVLAVLAFLRG